MVLEKPNSFHVAEYGAGGAGLEEPDCCHLAGNKLENQQPRNVVLKGLLVVCKLVCN